MQFAIITRWRAKTIVGEAKLLQSLTVGRARIHLAEHDNRDVLVIVPHQGPDVFLIGNADESDPHGHGYNMHTEYRQLAALEAAHGVAGAAK